MGFKSVEAKGIGLVKIYKHRRSRQIKLSVTHSSEVRVSLPVWVPYRMGLNFALKNERWIKLQLAQRPRPLDPTQRKAQLAKVKQKALEYLPGRLTELAQTHKIKFEQVRVRTMRSRWGSCSQKGKITLNMHLMNLPGNLIDYVICHELTHIKVHGHGTRFWDELGRLYPEYKAAKKQIRLFSPRFN